MVRTFQVELNAAHTELPLFEASTIVGSVSTAFITGVPATVGNWRITTVYVRAKYPDNSTVTIEAAKGAQSTWTATMPQTEYSGRIRNGFEVLADGIDENGDPVTGYTLGIADFAVYTRSLTIDEQTSFTLNYFNTVPEYPKTGDVATIDGTLKFYDGAEWIDFTSVDLTPYYTKDETDAAIDALAAYYITYDAAGAAFPTRAALINATTVYSGGVARVPTRNDYAVVLADEAHSGAEYRYIYGVAEGEVEGQWEAQYPIETNDYTALSSKPKINGVELAGEMSLSQFNGTTSDDLGRLFVEWKNTATADNRARGTQISFTPSAIGITQSSILRSVTVRTSDTVRNTSPVFVKLIDTADTSTAKAVAGPIEMGELDTDYTFTFASDYELLTTRDYRLVFYSSATSSYQQLVNLRLAIMSEETDVYFGTNRTWRPIISFKWTAENIADALESKASLNDLAERIPWTHDRYDNTTALTVGTRATGTVGANSVAIGSNVTASGANSIAVGRGTTASDEFAIAGGSSSKATTFGALAYGSLCEATGNLSVALGWGSFADGYASFAAGYKAVAGGVRDQGTTPHWTAFCWQGREQSASLAPDYYYAHGHGTFNIKPVAKDGSAPASGFFIGEDSMKSRLYDAKFYKLCDVVTVSSYSESSGIKYAEYTLEDHACNYYHTTVEIDELRLKLPPLNSGYCRDMIVRVEIGPTTAPSLVLIPQSGADYQNTYYENGAGSIPELKADGATMIYITQTAPYRVMVEARQLGPSFR